MLGHIAGKVAVVTGGASGVGRGIAEALLEEGARVVLADIEAEPLENTARELGVAGVVADVADRASMHALATLVGERFGTANILVSNAGVGQAGPIDGLTEEDWSWMLGVNLLGVVNGLAAFLPMMARDPLGGHVVNTASMSGVAPLEMLGAYAAAKSGVVALTEALAMEQCRCGNRVGASVLLLGPTRSHIASSARNRPPSTEPTGFGEYHPVQDPDHPIIMRTPDEIGRLTVRAIRDGELYVFTHPEQFYRVERRFEAMRAAAGRASAPGG